MVNQKWLMEIARKWSKVATLGRRASPKGGHFAAYTKDGRRFLVPIDYLNFSILRELLDMSEEEFGVAGGRPIVLPCDAVFMEHVMATLQTTARFKRPRTIISNFYTPCSASSLSTISSRHLDYMAIS